MAQSDLIPENISVPTSVAPGASLSVSWLLANQGTAAANSTSTTELRINQSSSSASGTNLTGVSTAALAGNSSVSQSATLTAPTTPGTYYVWVLADDFSNVTNQSNTSNDLQHSVAFTVTAPPAQSDLLPENISVPTSVAPGASLSVSWLLANQGSGAANSTSTTELRINQSSTSFSGTDLAGVSTAALAGNSSVSQSTTLTAPTTPGTYYVWVIADNNSQVTNQSTTSNDEAHSVAFTVAAPAEPSLSYVSPNPVPASSSQQTIKLIGSNFVSGDSLYFTYPGGTTNNLSPISIVSGTEIDYNYFNDQSGSGAWTVQVKSPDGTLSNAASFTVSGGSSTIDPFISYTDATPNQPTAADVVAAAEKYIGALWYADNCTGLLWAVSAAIGAPFYETIQTVTGQTTTAGLTVVPDPVDGYVVPPTLPEAGSSSDWTTFFSSDWTVQVQVGDLVRIPGTVPLGPTDPSSGHSFIVVGNADIENPTDPNTWLVIDNTVQNPSGPTVQISRPHTFDNPGNIFDMDVLSANSAYVSYLTASPSASPSLSSVSPTSYTANNTNQTMELVGSNFVSGDTLTFVDPQNRVYANEPTTYVSSSELETSFNNDDDPGTWTVEVNSSTSSSGNVSFSVATSQLADGTVAGFDVSAFPGMNVMDWLKANTNLTWVGYYLLAPDRTGTSWFDTRSELTSDGWTIAPIYVGQQDTSAWTRTASQGAIDADQAASELGPGGEGFAPGTVCYLDIENGLVSSSELIYANAWCAELSKDGYTPGIYAPGSDFTELTSQYPNAQAAIEWVADYQNSSYFPASGTTIFSDPGLASIHPNASAWQYDIQPFNIATPFETISVDLDVVSDALLGDTTPPSLTISSAGGLTNQTAQTISGTIDAADFGLTVSIYDGTTLLGTATPAGNGNWSESVTLLSTQGNQVITAKATDAAGNVGASNAVTYTLDTQTTDTEGSVVSQTIPNGNGTQLVNTYDPENTANSTWSTSSYDANGNLTSQVGTNLDGTHWLTMYDVNNLYSWLNVTIDFDAQWNRTSITGTNDNGTHTVTAASIAAAYDTLLWFATPFNPNWNSTSAVSLTGDSENDTLVGGAGDDTFTAGTGNDLFYGNGGSNTFVFGPGSGKDTIADFQPTQDTIQFNLALFANYAAVLQDTTQMGANTVIQDDANSSVTLENVVASSLTANNFHFP
jgi:hypothetical protein